MIYIIPVGMITFIILKKWIESIPITPDPWDEIIDENQLEEALPICIKCFKEVENKNQHYCSKCGHITGEYTRYIPFVNLAFNYSIFGNLWNDLIGKDKSLFKRVFSFILILLLAPIMLIFGIPVLIFSKLNSK